ncbi:MAG: peptidase M13 [Phenylobacterium sp. RIFCSPHIGHO2_01_FULL_69_31]|uniref:M13 family metallopeptidase n=1 Tax=Phenylobacterium sp. RIFCSPHIGHO2_01_FULL_69_31 TaxID=1801944 RepID=UPI0008CB9D80|nr:M13-type metalloendopeptidase [Phenylobacterium sp. RIFCSPHIGHO2_01_FULL_69_31]OHB30477.1 MAG: peptidase M13 [Phenylobacterium sp. RIFCSPHIGHO2_01_FULL_69_31]
MKTAWLAAACAAALLAASPSAFAADAATTAPETAARDLSKAPRMGPWGFDMAGRDTASSPGKSLFAYANGAYMEKLTIPADRSTYGAFNVLDELSKDRMRAVIEKAAAGGTAGGVEAKVGALYRSFMDEAKVEALGARPLEADLARIRGARTRAEVARLMGATAGGFGQSFFNPQVYDDAKDPLKYAVYLSQGGLTLPDRDYYLDAKFEPQRKAYEAYVAKLLGLAGWPNPEASAKAIVAMETEVAKISWTRAERRDDDKTYNPVETAKLAAFAPGFDWSAFLDGAGLAKATRVIAAENTAFPKIAAIYGATDVETLKAWLAFTTVDQAASYLSKDFDQARFDFRAKTLSGTPAQQPRWKRGVNLVDANLGEAVGKLYVDAYFPADSKARMEALVGDLKTAMGARIQKLDWMGPETKRKALEKLGKFTVKIGYPDKWRDYSGLQIVDGDLYGNVERAAAFDWNFRTARLNQPVDRAEWEMTPATINAYYSSTKNEIVFPAAILQPPFFDPEGDPAVNYGGIGGVIGHEITHGFDDQGRKSDGDGRLSEWWTKDDEAKFAVQAERLGKQYSATEVLPGAKINGELTMGENIADLGGLLLALDAYRLSLKGKPAPVIDGLTGDQRVFLGWAQVWRGKYRDDFMKQILVSDPHAPPVARVDLPVRNIDAFYEAFGVKPGDPMYVPPEQRVRIW